MFSDRFKSRGLFVEPPTVGFTHGMWKVDLPADMPRPARQQPQQQLSFSKQHELFDERAAMQAIYLEHIQQAMEEHESKADVRIAACILEPVLQVRELAG